MNFKYLILFTLVLFSISAGAQKIQLKKEGKGFWFTENEQKIFFFQRQLNDSVPSHSRCNYFHPVYDLNGVCITEDFPSDHLHQRGIYWAWLQIIIDGEQIADGWHLQNFVQEIDEVEFKNTMNGNGVFSYTSYWKNPEKPNDPFMQEQTQVNIYPQQINYRRIDFTIQLRALEHNLQLGGANNEKGYGGFSVRLKTDDNTVFTDIDNKQIIPTELAIASDRIMDISNKENKSGVTIIAWEQNPGETKWILRQQMSAQNAAWPGREPVEISVSQPTVLKYTLIIHKGKRKAIPLKYLLKETTK
jgi:hypothetical protein